MKHSQECPPAPPVLRGLAPRSRKEHNRAANAPIGCPWTQAPTMTAGGSGVRVAVFALVLTTTLLLAALACRGKPQLLPRALIERTGVATLTAQVGGCDNTSPP